jgi:hypothetical protein
LDAINRVKVRCEGYAVVKQQRVVIYGSGPDCSLKMAEHSYFANYAALRYTQEELAGCGGTLTHCGNVTALIPTKTVLNNIYESYVGHSERLAGYRFDRRILFATKPKYHALFDGRGGVEYMSPEMLASTIRSVLGRTSFFTWSHLLGGVLKRARRSGRMVRQALFGGDDTDAYFRPSSGVMTLILAVHRHGLDSIYEMQGFEFKRRSHDHVTQSIFIEKSPYFLPHIEADRLVLKQLRRMGVDLTYPSWD